MRNLPLFGYYEYESFSIMRRKAVAARKSKRAAKAARKARRRR